MGLLGSVVLIVVGPAIWVSMLHHARPIFPYAYPALASMPLAFATAWAASRFDPKYGDEEDGRIFARLTQQAQRHGAFAAPADANAPAHVNAPANAH